MTKSELAQKVRTFREKVEIAAQTISDDQIEACLSLFPEWKVGVEYAVGYRVYFDGIIYKCLQAHTSQADWTPTTAVSLWAKVLAGIEDIIAEWEQPDSTNPYMTGDKVTFNGKTYESVIDNNTWSPSAYPAGWKEV